MRSSGRGISESRWSSSRPCGSGTSGRAIACTHSCCRAWPRTPVASRRRASSTTPTSSRVSPTAKGCVSACARLAAVVVTDDYPAFFLRRMVTAAAARTDVLVESVDSNGLLPLAGSDRAYPTAYAFRRFLQKALPIHLQTLPRPDALRDFAPTLRATLPASLLERWPAASDALLSGHRTAVGALPIDHAVGRVTTPGGSRPARATLATFVDERLLRYASGRNAVEDTAASGLSPVSSFRSHLGARGLPRRDVARAVDDAATGGRRRAAGEGWWGASARRGGVPRRARHVARAGVQHVSPSARRLRHATTSLPSLGTEDARRALPRSARARLHARGVRGRRSRTIRSGTRRSGSSLREGRMHNYLRMLWGKKILEWSRASGGRAGDHDRAEQPLRSRRTRSELVLAASSGCWARYDRPWAPERPIFGTVRYMSSENTARQAQKLRGPLDYLRERYPGSSYVVRKFRS